MTKFDGVVRFLYCWIPLHPLLFWHVYSSKPELQWKRFETMTRTFRRFDVGIRGARAIELGPGNSTLIAKALLSRGAVEVVQIDRFSRVNDSAAQEEYETTEEEFLVGKIAVADRKTYRSGTQKSSIRYSIGDISTLVVDRPADLLYSVSVLEHVKDVESAVIGMRRNLRRGGIMWHHIDLRDHYNFLTPHLFYKYSAAVWHKFLIREGVSYTNRLRVDDFRRAFVENGFDILHEEVEKVPLPADQSIADSLAGKAVQVLETTQLDILLRAR